MVGWLVGVLLKRGFGGAAKLENHHHEFPTDSLVLLLAPINLEVRRWRAGSHLNAINTSSGQSVSNADDY